MITKLRRRHLLSVGALAVVAPAVLAIAIASRPTWLNEGLPSGLAAEPGAGRAVAAMTGTRVRFGDLPVGAVVAHDADGTLRVTFDPVEALATSELLVYWSSTGESSVDDDSVLLGALPFGGGRLSVPVGLGSGGDVGAGGSLLLYDLATRSVRGHAPLPSEVRR